MSQRVDPHWDQKYIFFVAGKMRTWCDAAFTALSKQRCEGESAGEFENCAIGIFMARWMEDLITKGSSLHCDFACYDTVKHFVSLRYTEIYYHVCISQEVYAHLATELLRYVKS